MPPTKVRKIKIARPEDKLFNIFKGSEVYVAMKSIKGDLLADSPSSNAMFFGVLMDSCPEYYYLGSGEEITAAVQRSEVAAVLDRTMIDEQLSVRDMEIPEGTEFQ